MKHWRQRAAALGLALAIALTPVAQASEALGWEIQGGTVELSVGTSLTKQVFWSDTYSDLRTERYFTYTPNPGVTPTVVYGNKILDRATLTAMAKTLEDQGRRVVGGVNGDLYVLATGAPLGVVVTDGVVRSLPGSDNAGYHGVGFRADGTAFVGRPGLAATVTFQGLTFPLEGGINKVRRVEGNYVLLTEDFAATTQNSDPGVDVIMTPVLENLGQASSLALEVRGGAEGDIPALINAEVVRYAKPTIGGRVTYQVEQVLESTGAIPIPEGKVVLSINQKSDPSLVGQLKSLQPGERVDLDITAKEGAWPEASQAMGGLYRLVTGGKVEAGLGPERTAYSAVGVKADGTAVFYTVDGKQPGYSIGATLTQVAARMVELGCVNAISLDGGGSTTVGATYPDGGNMGVVNKPADGSQRANSVALFLTTDLKPSGLLSGLYVTPGDGFLLSGAKVSLTAKGLDSNYYAMPLNGSPAWSVEKGDGTVSQDGVFTAGGKSGITKVTGMFGGVTGSATLTVVSNPDGLILVDAATGKPVTALALDPGGKVDMTAVASYRTLPLTSQDSCFTWSIDSDVAAVDGEGVVIAGAKTGRGNLTVAAGGKSVTIPVWVTGHVKTLENFEGGIGSVAAAGGLKATWEKNIERVRYGRASLRADYDAALGTASLTTTLVAARGEKYLNLWVYGDGSQNSLTATVADGQGATQELLLTGLSFEGWKYVSVALPEGALALRSVNLLFGDAAKPKGTFWLDQITSSNEAIQDVEPPSVAVSTGDGQLSATIGDVVDQIFTAGQVTVTYDGVVIQSTFDPATGVVKAALPMPDGKLHRARVIAVDASGNIGSGSNDIKAEAGRVPAFADTANHWAGGYADYLYDRAVTKGVPGAVEGEFLFQPDRSITRGELFTLVGRWLGLDFAKYADVVLPFADTDKIPVWAVPGVKAMYALGYLKGSDGGDGKLYANAAADISRAEAMTILGRVQAKGYAQADLTMFGDGAKVPAWAAEWIKTLVGQGVVSGGDDKRIRPFDPVKRGEVAKMLVMMT